MEKPATIKDIAKRLNISISTVSRAMRNAPDVNAETKRAVMALSEELNYQPNRLALSLKQKQTHNIGVIIPNLDYMLSTMVKGIDEVALEAGYTVMVCQSNESFGREIVNTRRLLDSLVDGFIISVQASYFHYCTPRNNSGPYSHVELGFPSDFDEILFDYSEDASEMSDMTQTVFPYTPLEVLYESLKTHGDFELEDDSFEELSENERSLDFSKYFT